MKMEFAHRRTRFGSGRATQAALLCGIASACLWALPAAAQTTPASAPGIAAQDDQTAAVSDVVVTGSRVTNGFRAPTPTNTLSSESLETLQTANVATALARVPSFKASNSPNAIGLRANAPGVSQADLRGLGPNRTLMLINGERVVPNAPTNVVGTVAIAPDLNAVPALMIDRVDLVTGGASAQWGSDAMGGVINLILKRHYNGLTMTAQAGTSQYDDAEQVRIGALAGTDFLDDRLHVLGAVEYTDTREIDNIYSRPWSRREVLQIANPGFATNGLPAIIISDNVHTYTSPGGLISGPANFSLRNFQFQPDGTLTPFNPGTLNNGTFQIGGDGFALTAQTPQSPEVERYMAAGRIEYDLTDNTRVYLEGSYADVKGHITLNPFRDSGSVIRNDNPFLPAQVVTAMAAANITSFTLNRINYDIGGSNEAFSTNRTPRIAAGAEGTFGETWKWDAHIAYSENINRLVTPHNRIANLYAFARDAVRVNGQIVCRATVPGASFNAAAAGCVPINIFGQGAPSAAAIAYVTGVSDETSNYTQTSAAANVRGEPFSTWAGPVSVAAGLEYRRESQKVIADPISQSGQFQFGNTSTFAGDFDVKESYVETIVPLARDMPGVHALDFNAAIRFAQYSTIGDSTTWKFGAVYEPFEGFRIRASRSRDLRAPALYELLSQGGAQNLNLVVRGFSVNIPTNVSIGNPNLQPEIGNTFTAGVVIEPPQIPGLKASIDYYDIKIDDAITTVFPTTIAALCNAGQAQFCNAFTFAPSGAATSLNFATVNAASLGNQGIDFAISYATPLSRFSEALPGSVSLDFNGTYVRHVNVNVGFGGTTIDRAGENSNFNNYSLPRLRMSLLGTYSIGPVDLSADVNFISGGKLDNTWNTAPSNTVTYNHVDDFVYLNLFSSFKFGEGDRYRLFASMNNVFNKAPPAIPSASIFTYTNGQYYDLVGRYFQAGLTVKF
jgi:iron complex outermembrane receptor protein